MLQDVKIVFIIPPDNIDTKPVVYPPLGLLYIAASLKQKNFCISICDMRENNYYIPTADVYCFSATTPQINFVKKLSNSVRDKAFTILGGPHASCAPETVEKDFDCIVVGEGDGIITDIIETRKKGIVYADPPDINKLPFPSRNLLSKKYIINSEIWSGYRYNKDENNTGTTVISSRGCPFKCAFCANIPTKTRFRAAENFVSEIENIIEEYECKHFRFLDDNFILNKQRLKKLSPILNKLNIIFRCSVRSDMLTDEICELLYNAGCREVGFGIESGDDRVLKAINKEESIKDHKKAIKIAEEYNLRTKVFLMAGLPHETWESIEMTKQFIEETRPDKWILTLFTPYPGSPIWENPGKFGVKILDKNFDNYFQTYPSKSIIETFCATSEELTQHFEYLYNYLNEIRRNKE